jgi:ectoine hydroxylase-related dioxygenase (phytanoyl-CoA dioxygenase family)
MMSQRETVCPVTSDVVEALRTIGYAIVPSLYDETFLARTRSCMHSVYERIRSDVGAERLERAGETGVLRLMFRYDNHFFRFLETPEVLEIVDATVGPTAILHLQNGFILPSAGAGAKKNFQTTFHRDFPRYLNGYVASLNVLVAVDEFTADNGATLAVPGSHQLAGAPEDGFMTRNAVPLTCEAGSIVVFDSTLWHAAGGNVSGSPRLAINHQFTRSWIKQQIDYVRALGENTIMALPPRTRQLLGWYTRVVTSLDEYYRPEDQRLYRRGQG